VESKAEVTHQSVGLPDLFRCLLQASLGRVYLAIAAVNVMLHIAHIIKLEAPLALLLRVGLLILGSKRLVMDLGARTQFILGVGEEVVRTAAYEIRATDLGVGDAELRRALVRSAHKLFAHKLLWSRVSMSIVSVTA
jgi:hypothetical protein